MKRSITRSIAFTIAALALFAMPVAPLVKAQVSQKPAQAVSTHKTDEIHIKLSDEAAAVLQNGAFVSTTVDLSAVNSQLSPVMTGASRMFNVSADTIRAQRAAIKAKSGKTVADLSGYFIITLRPGTDQDLLISQLKNLPFVTEAYAAPLPVKAPVTGDFTGLQRYQSSAPAGMGVTTTTSQPGYKGDNVTLADIEYSWNSSHEDITDSALAGARLNNGTPNDPFNSDGNGDNHGTAVTGITNGDVNGFGINGIVPNATLKLINANNVERGWDVANSVYLAQANLLPGDVLLIEQQAWGPNNYYAPVEYVPAVYDAITYATANGIIVVEGAGNGSYIEGTGYVGGNLDDPMFGSAFTTKANSGAIIVGAGAACGYQPNRSRMSFSNYGTRVDVQGWGECVTTTGYGDYFGSLKNQFYTSIFNGTSSASALVAGIAAAISSAKEAQTGVHYTSVQMRNLLVSTGSAQDTSVSGKIGPLPNLANALYVAPPAGDTTAPTAPTTLTATAGSNGVTLNWKAATDNVGVTGYRVYRDNVLIATVTSLSFTDINAKRNTTYTYKVQAIDAAGNASVFNSVTIKVPAKK